jgi:hypothetical protein
MYLSMDTSMNIYQEPIVGISGESLDISYTIYVYPPDDITDTVKKNIERFGKNYCFTKLTNNHMTKLFLLQKINKSINRNTKIYIYLHPAIDLDDYNESLHPKILNILKYTPEVYNISIINL